MAIKNIQSVQNPFQDEKIMKEIFRERLRNEILSWTIEDKISFLFHHYFLWAGELMEVRLLFDLNSTVWKKVLQNDRWIDGRTDWPLYRVTCIQLKMEFRFEPGLFCQSLLEVKFKDMNRKTHTTGGHRRQPEVADILRQLWMSMHCSVTYLSFRRIQVKQRMKLLVAQVCSN